jgi:restriction system protein
MTPSQYEAVVANHFRQLGYAVEDRSATNDWGVDLFAVKGDARVAIQAKMYGGTPRPVNRAQIMELYGAAAYFECARAALATNGRVMADAEIVAAKLGIEILTIAALAQPGAVTVHEAAPIAAFDRLWEQYIMPLVGRTLTRSDGTTNTILAVDWAGVDRITSGGNRQRIKIEVFRWAVDALLADGRLTRGAINAMYPGRASSGIVLLLAQIPDFEYVDGELRGRR